MIWEMRSVVGCIFTRWKGIIGERAGGLLSDEAVPQIAITMVDLKINETLQTGAVRQPHLPAPINRD